MLSKANSRLYILRVCKFHGHPNLLFQSLIISVFTYRSEVLGYCYYDKYLKRIDRLFVRAFRSGYCFEEILYLWPFLVFLMRFFYFWHSLSYSPQHKYSLGKVGHVTPAAKGLLLFKTET